MKIPHVWLLAIPLAFAQDETINTSALASSSGVPANDVTADGTYISITSTIFFSESTAAATRNGTNGTSTQTEPTVLVGGQSTTTGNLTASRTSTVPRPTNTQPCNGYVEFCQRSYSNITNIAAHNFPFITQNNAARNQELPVLDQLTDGIRMLQAQAHLVNGTMRFCHSSCDLLDAGPVEDSLREVVGWLDRNPFEVVTLLIGNYDYANVQVEPFVAPIRDSGLERYAYIPPKFPMQLEDWPTLAELIITGKRAVVFLDYNANQTEVPFILDEFSQMWETPFSPTNPEFPCTTNRPPDMTEQQPFERMYMANHNLNVDFSGLGINLLVPDVSQINQTNADEGNVSLAKMANECTADWNRPPNFLLVDFYNRGNFPGSVFAVAAEMNNVTYNGECCGKGAQSAASERLLSVAHLAFALGIAAVTMLL